MCVCVCVCETSTPFTRIFYLQSFRNCSPAPALVL